MTSQTYEIGDCLSVMQKLGPDSIQLIYMDPPFGTQTIWHGEEKTGASSSSFQDGFKSPEALVEYLDPRWQFMRQVLTSTGILVVHLNKVALHYAKVRLDQIFGRSNFLNEIVVRNTNPYPLKTTRRFRSEYTSLLVYTKTGNHKFTPQYRAYSPASLGKGRRYTVLNPIRNEISQGKSHKNRERVQLKNNPRGVWIGNVWQDSYNVRGKERTGHPTQKSLKLLTRIISSFSDEGDIILDPFAGSGTALVAAEKLNRHGIGIDINPKAKEVWEGRRET